MVHSFLFLGTLKNSVAFNYFHSGYQFTGTLANSEDSDESTHTTDQDEVSHKAPFHQGLHCVLR